MNESIENKKQNSSAIFIVNLNASPSCDSTGNVLRLQSDKMYEEVERERDYISRRVGNPVVSVDQGDFEAVTSDL
jgi:hypothetical protein